MEPFKKEERDGQPVLFYIESWVQAFPGLTAGITSRLGGVSEAPFHSMNCGLHVQDRTEHVVTNRERFADALDLPFDTFTYAEQVHGNEVYVVSNTERGMGRASRHQAIQAKDGFVSNEKDLVLCALFADCVPLFFYDPVQEVIGLAHAGWKGTVLNIAMSTITAMANTFGSKQEDIRAVIGPSIGACCYEIDAVVADRVKGVLKDMEAVEVLPQVLTPMPENKFRLNLQQLNRKFMIKAGVLSSNIEVTELCTSCSTDVFFSHRKEGGSTGRMVAWIAMRS